VRGNNEQEGMAQGIKAKAPVHHEVQQSTRNQHGTRHQGQDPLEASLHDAPTIDLK
jgi:hypothetical protein